MSYFSYRQFNDISSSRPNFLFAKKKAIITSKKGNTTFMDQDLARSSKADFNKSSELFYETKNSKF